ncbi:MarR family winged helix-turn-helix transcriptional regulator [Chitinibacter sp. GC72]|jgi:DNA-binding MarR family transcriptional regulator|uniref:MarR family winged helix-turn-helix transcriptional regulator n=1 Tax=Chitinibacter sp. GC72 TaxID=1526917 RepID=UPI0012F9BE80|nr:MarR family transcriptional regulator [Chitinibacter sp. GC72]
MVDITADHPGASHTEYELNCALELLFYGYKGFTAQPDAILAQRGLARVHHRILYFVGRQGGLSVNQLLAKLGVSKQALNVPLRQLQEAGLICATPSEIDKRVKCLALSDEGIALEEALSGAQRAILDRVFAECGQEAEAGFKQVLGVLAKMTQ